MHASLVYANIPSLITFTLEHPQIIIEFNNLAESINRIRNIAFYQQQQEVTSCLSSIISFLMDSERLHRLHNELMQAELQYFTNHWEENTGKKTLDH